MTSATVLAIICSFRRLVLASILARSAPPPRPGSALADALVCRA
jgi:hypothetical protein